MTKEMLRVVARVVALPDKVEEVKSVLIELIEPTRQENGCIVYEMLQNQADPTDFVFVEEWESDAALDAHMSRAHFIEAVSKLDGLLAIPGDIRRYRLVK